MVWGSNSQDLKGYRKPDHEDARTLIMGSRSQNITDAGNMIRARDAGTKITEHAQLHVIHKLLYFAIVFLSMSPSVFLFFLVSNCMYSYLCIFTWQNVILYFDIANKLHFMIGFPRKFLHLVFLLFFNVLQIKFPRCSRLH